MKLSSAPRTPADLSPSLDRGLKMYALTATAAGVGILALTPSAAGEVIYTKVHKVVQYNHGPLYFDLNNAGVKDFALAGQLTATTS